MFKNAHKFFVEDQFASFRLILEVSLKNDHEDIRCDCVDWVCDKWTLELEDLNWIQPA